MELRAQRFKFPLSSGALSPFPLKMCKGGPATLMELELAQQIPWRLTSLKIGKILERELRAQQVPHLRDRRRVGKIGAKNGRGVRVFCATAM